jgi:hypothetical protein
MVKTTRELPNTTEQQELHEYDVWDTLKGYAYKERVKAVSSFKARIAFAKKYEIGLFCVCSRRVLRFELDGSVK